MEKLNVCLPGIFCLNIEYLSKPLSSRSIHPLEGVGGVRFSGFVFTSLLVGLIAGLFAREHYSFIFSLFKAQ